jgi:hypothetical protein
MRPPTPPMTDSEPSIYDLPAGSTQRLCCRALWAPIQSLLVR